MAITGDHVIQFTPRALFDGQAVQNVLHYTPTHSGAGGFSQTITAVNNALVTFWQTFVVPQLGSAYVVQEYHAVSIEGTQVNPVDPNKFILQLGDEDTQTGGQLADTGGIAGPFLPSCICVTIQKKTGLAGKSNKGSLRLACIPESYTEAAAPNTLTAAAVAAFSGILGDLVNPIALAGNDGLLPTLFQRTLMFRGAQPKGNTLFAREPWSTALLNLFIGTQNSRKRKRRLGD